MICFSTNFWAAAPRMGWLKVIEIGWPTPTVIPLRGKLVALTLPFGTTVVNVRTVSVTVPSLALAVISSRYVRP